MALLIDRIDLYEHQLKDAHKNNVSKFFEDLVKKSGVNEEENATTVKSIRKKEAEIKAVDKKLKGQKTLRGFLIFLDCCWLYCGNRFYLSGDWHSTNSCYAVAEYSHRCFIFPFCQLV